MNVLITGISGFVGGHLAEFLKDIADVKIFGTVYGPMPDYFDALKTKTGVNTFECDLLDKEAVSRLVETVKPDLVIHLAALSSVADTLNHAERVITNNVISELNLLDAVKEFSPTARTLVISSGEVYGKATEDELPLSETTDLRPLNPYTVSKLGQEFLAYQYYAAYELPIIIARPFNHTGPRQEGNFVVPSFIKQIAQIEVGQREPIMRVGNLESARDFSDVRDIVRAYWLLVNKGEPGEVYNICSGKALRIGELLNFLISQSTAKIEIKVDPELYRPGDIPILLGDYSKLSEQTGWAPQFDIESTLKETLGYWQNQVTNNWEDQ
ncbi:MAG: GDP-mannose 4,6-dehydratase [Actinobacteria bacterium]|nr:GDP-mannose 4,6-dehydratase [Actinomycetota bacterium]